jgi:hypothetical protein
MSSVTIAKRSVAQVEIEIEAEILSPAAKKAKV